MCIRDRVSITAEPLTPTIGQAIIIGGIGGILCMYGMKLLDKLKIDLTLRPQNINFETYYKLTCEYENLRS